MGREKLMKKFCENCKNADNTVHYSSWHYCNDPKNFRDFTIIRHFSDFGGKEIKVSPPIWCPYKD